MEVSQLDIRDIALLALPDQLLVHDPVKFELTFRLSTEPVFLCLLLCADQVLSRLGD